MKYLMRILLLLGLFQLPTFVAANEFGIKLGLLGDGELESSEGLPYYTRGTTGNYAFEIFADKTLEDKFSLGLHLDVYNFTDNYDDEALTMIDLGGQIKMIFHAQNFQIRPGIGIGYGQMEFRDETSSHLLIQGMVELAFSNIISDKKIIAEIGFVSSPAGGIEGETDLTFAPMFYLRGGIGF